MSGVGGRGTLRGSTPGRGALEAVPVRLVVLFTIIAGLLQLAPAQQVPAPTLFDEPWQDPTLYEPGVHRGRAEQVPDGAALPVYHLDWTLESLTLLVARQEVRVTNYSNDSWNELYFQLLPNRIGGQMAIDRVRLDGEETAGRLMQEESVLAIDLPAQLEPGQSTVVALDYRLEVPESGGRNYGILAYSQGVLSLAHAYALLAVYDDEGWDVDSAPRYGDLVYARSSYFRVRLDAPARLGVAASGRRTSWQLAGGRQLLEFTAGPVRDFYLAAAQEWEQVIRVEDGVTVRGHALPGTAARMETAVETAARALELFGELYGHYPFREFDIVPITTSALGVEFPGIIALRHELLEENQPVLLESTVVHEVAHQWFYSLVGNDQVSEPWLDESVTQYLTMRYYGEVHGERARLLFRQGLFGRWEQVGRNRLPIGLPVAEYTGNEYGAIIYGLGPLVVERLAEELGQAAFDDFLRDYSENNAFELATTSEFRELAERHCDCSLDLFFEEWVRSRQQ